MSDQKNGPASLSSSLPTSEGQAMREAMETYQRAIITDLPSKPAILLRPGNNPPLSLKSLIEEYQPRPERREGTDKLLDLDSFIAWTNRHKGDPSVLFATDNAAGEHERIAPQLTAVIDYHDQGPEVPDNPFATARHCRHRGVYRFRTSKEFDLWTATNCSDFGQAQFAEFLEEQIIDVIEPPEAYRPDSGESPSVRAAGGDHGEQSPDERLADLLRRIGGRCASVQGLIALSRDLAVYSRESLRQAVNLSSGERQLQFNVEHTDADGKPLSIPNVFLIAIPIFEGGPRYRMACRLRYRARSGSVTWSYDLLRWRDSFDHAFGEACERAAKDTALPLFKGSPAAAG